MFKEVPEDIDADADPIAIVLDEMDHFGIEQGDDRRRGRARARASTPLRSSTPTASSPATRSTRTAAWRACATLVRAYEELGIKAATAFPAGMNPQVPINDKKFFPHLRQVRRARHPDLRVHRRARAARADGVPEDRADRRGLLVLPRAEVRDAPRRRAVGRARREAHAQVAEPLLLDLARSRRSTTPRRSSTTPTPAAPTR